MVTEDNTVSMAKLCPLCGATDNVFILCMMFILKTMIDPQIHLQVQHLLTSWGPNKILVVLITFM